MKILQKGKGYSYLLTCPDCVSNLEAARDELKTTLGDTKVRFTCPVCEQIRSVDWDEIVKIRKPND